MRTVCLAEAKDLPPLEELYLHLNPERPSLAPNVADQILAQILSTPGLRLFVCFANDQLVASAMLALVPNLMRGGRPHALLESVVTHADFRRQGHGRAVVQAALDAAWAANAHHVMLSGRKDPAVQRFYESCGFEVGLKTGYVARSPRR